MQLFWGLSLVTELGPLWIHFSQPCIPNTTLDAFLLASSRHSTKAKTFQRTNTTTYPNRFANLFLPGRSIVIFYFLCQFQTMAHLLPSFFFSGGTRSSRLYPSSFLCFASPERRITGFASCGFIANLTYLNLSTSRHIFSPRQPMRTRLL